MTEPLLAIIGGSGLYDLAGLTDTRWVAVDTPWGRRRTRSSWAASAALTALAWPSCRATAAATASRPPR